MRFVYGQNRYGLVSKQILFFLNNFVGNKVRAKV